MGNYFNELRWKIIRANNLLQFIHQVTIEVRFRKPVLNGHSKIDKTNILMTNDSLMKVERIAENILQYFWSALSDR